MAASMLSSCVSLPMTQVLVLAGIVDAHQVGGADAVGDGAEIGIAGNAGGEFLAAVGVDADLAEQFDFDAEDVVLVLRPRRWLPVCIE